MAVNCLADICSFRPDDRLLHLAPLSHGSGMYLIPALSRGADNVIDAGGSFDPDRVLRFAEKERLTVLPFLAPTMIVRLLEVVQLSKSRRCARSSTAAPRSICGIFAPRCSVLDQSLPSSMVKVSRQ
jgi:acyl-CoA synthetase (AMP-forming)/AMP-acid ligase II